MAIQVEQAEWPELQCSVDENGMLVLKCILLAIIFRCFGAQVMLPYRLPRTRTLAPAQTKCEHHFILVHLLVPSTNRVSMLQSWSAVAACTLPWKEQEEESHKHANVMVVRRP